MHPPERFAALRKLQINYTFADKLENHLNNLFYEQIPFTIIFYLLTKLCTAAEKNN